MFFLEFISNLVYVSTAYYRYRLTEIHKKSLTTLTKLGTPNRYLISSAETNGKLSSVQVDLFGFNEVLKLSLKAELKATNALYGTKGSSKPSLRGEDGNNIADRPKNG